MSKNVQQDWFKTWFDSKYYHLLYNHRNEEEAAQFISNIIQFLKIKQSASILDLACGEGRHSKFLANIGFDVFGVDLSENSINTAKAFEKDNLQFATMDMRKLEFEKPFNYIFNLFTSFGYFDEVKDNLQTLKSINNNLTEGGVLVIDFMNAVQVEKNLIHKEIQQKGDILFKIERKIEAGKVIKSINFKAESKDFQFEEKVQLFTKNQLESMLVQNDFRVKNIFGNYDLEKFEAENSKRLIIIAEKI